MITPSCVFPLLSLVSAQVDIGQGAKPAGYYVQRSYGLFPAPWPQDSPELPRICHLFELLGMFVGKCIQDGRRVDLPLSNPFFKLMCVHSGGGGVAHGTQAPHPSEEADLGEEEGSESPQPVSDDDSDSTDNDKEQGSNMNDDDVTLSNEKLNSSSQQQPPPRTSTGSEGAERRGEASLKEAELLLLSAEDTEISKDHGSTKYEVTLEELGAGTEVPWFDQILSPEDLVEVNPYRGEFLKQLKGLVSERDTVLDDESLSNEERGRRLSEITLPGKQENIPGAKVEDLW